MKNASSSPLLRLPPELIGYIFESLCQTTAMISINALRGSKEFHSKLSILLAPLHINQYIRQALWQYPRFWRRLAEVVNVGRTLNQHGYKALLRLCNERSGSTLQMMDTRDMTSGSECFAQILQCVKIFSNSAPSLKAIKMTFYHIHHSCRCSQCSPPHYKTDRLQRFVSNATSTGKGSTEVVDIETTCTNTLFGLLSKATHLQALLLHPEEWPQRYVIQDLAASKVLPTPLKLHFSALDRLVLQPAGREFCKRLASKVEVLVLYSSAVDQLPINTASSPVQIEKPIILYTTILKSAASTVRHLQVSLIMKEFDVQAFINSSFDCLETMAIHILPPAYGQAPPPTFRLSSNQSRQPLPSLIELNAPGRFLNIIETPLIKRAGLSIETPDEIATINSCLDRWNHLSILALYLDPDERELQRPDQAIEPILAHLIPPNSRNTSRALPCPQLQALGIYDGHASWIGADFFVEELPRPWEWREVGMMNSQALLRRTLNVRPPRTLGGNIATLEQERRRVSKNNKDDGQMKCKPLLEIRMIGFDLDSTAWKQLMKAQPSTRLFIWPLPPKTDLIKKLEVRNRPCYDLNDPSEEYLYKPKGETPSSKKKKEKKKKDSSNSKKNDQKVLQMPTVDDVD